MIEQRVTLRYGEQQIPPCIQAVQGDTGRDIIFELIDYEVPEGATVNYYVEKPSGEAVYNSASVLSPTEIYAHLTQQAIVEAGRSNGQVRILLGDEVITSFKFVIQVEKFLGADAIPSGTETNIFDDALQAAAEDAIEEIQAQTPVVTGMQNSIAPSYSNSQTYNVGDYVMYNAQLYKCNTAITTAEVWTDAHWTQVQIASDVSGLKSAIGNRYIMPVVKYPDTYVETNGVFTPYSGWGASDYIDISDLESIFVTGYIDPQPYNCFYDENKSFISNFMIGLTETEVQIPLNAKYMVISNHSARFEKLRIRCNIPRLNLLDKFIRDYTIKVVIGTVGKYVGIGNEAGQIKDDANWSISPYIDVSQMETIYAKVPNEAEAYNAFYDENKVFISNFTIFTTKTAIHVPYNAKYMVISNMTSRFPNIEASYDPANAKNIESRVYNNTIDVYADVVGYYIKINGEIDSASGWAISQKIDVSQMSAIYAKFPIEALYYNAFYDKDDNFISYFTVLTTETKINIPFNAKYMLVSNHMERFADISIKFDMFEAKTNNHVCMFPTVKGINKLGIVNNVPEQSIYSYRAAVEAGFKILLCDLQFTSDHVPVCIHDRALDYTAVIPGGTPVGSGIRVDDITLEQLNGYDFAMVGRGNARMYNPAFDGNKALQLKDFLMFCKMCGVQAYIEVKGGTKTEIQSAVEMVEKYGMIDSVSWAAYNLNAQQYVVYHADWIVEKNRTCRVALMSGGNGITAEDGYKTHLLALKTGANSVFCFNWNTETVTNDEVEWLAKNDIAYEVGIVSSGQGIINYMNGTNKYITSGIETEDANPEEVLKDYALNGN